MNVGNEDHGQGGGMMAEINITPFVDVMLVLLIIFMVTAPLMTTGMKVELPKVDAPPMSESEKQMTLSVTAEGAYFINDNEIPFAELEKKLVAIAKSNPDQDVFLRADGKVPYEKVAQLMAMCTKAGIPRMGMITQPGVPEE